MTHPRTRHVLVKLDLDPREHAGFVLAWRQSEGRWEALTTYFVEDEGRAITTWLWSHHLTPVESGPVIGSAYG